MLCLFWFFLFGPPPKKRFSSWPLKPSKTQLKLALQEKTFLKYCSKCNLALFSHSAPWICTTQFYTEADVLSTVLTSSRLKNLMCEGEDIFLKIAYVKHNLQPEHKFLKAGSVQL